MRGDQVVYMVHCFSRFLMENMCNFLLKGLRITLDRRCIISSLHLTKLVVLGVAHIVY